MVGPTLQQISVNIEAIFEDCKQILLFLHNRPIGMKSLHIEQIGNNEDNKDSQ